jgi:hypothetical protein
MMDSLTCAFHFLILAELELFETARVYCVCARKSTRTMQLGSNMLPE